MKETPELTPIYHDAGGEYLVMGFGQSAAGRRPPRPQEPEYRNFNPYASGQTSDMHATRRQYQEFTLENYEVCN